MSKENPYPYAGRWYWDDTQDVPHGPFQSQHDALYSLLEHIAPRPKRASSALKSAAIFLCGMVVAAWMALTR